MISSDFLQFCKFGNIYEIIIHHYTLIYVVVSLYKESPAFPPFDLQPYRRHKGEFLRENLGNIIPMIVPLEKKYHTIKITNNKYVPIHVWFYIDAFIVLRHKYSPIKLNFIR